MPRYVAFLRAINVGGRLIKMADLAAALEGLRTDLDDFTHSGSEVFWLCKSKQSDSKFSNALFERKLGAKTTIRRASMLERLAEPLRTPAGKG